MAAHVLRLVRFHRVGAPVHAVAVSGDGAYALIGSEQGLRLIDRRGGIHFRWGDRWETAARPFTAVALSPDGAAGLALERTGRLYRLDFDANGDGVHTDAHRIWEQDDDLYSLVVAPASLAAPANAHAPSGARQGQPTPSAGLVALGHHGVGLTALDAAGALLWRLAPRNEAGVRPATRTNHGRTWHAAFSPDGRIIYASALGSASFAGSPDHQAGPRYLLVAAEAATGRPCATAGLAHPVTLLAGLPPPLGVAAVHLYGGRSRVVAYRPDLRSLAWTFPLPAGETVTALTATPDAAGLILGTNSGHLWRIGALTGRALARYDLLFHTPVLSVAVSLEGHVLAGLANGQVAFLERHAEARGE